MKQKQLVSPLRLEDLIISLIFMNIQCIQKNR